MVIINRLGPAKDGREDLDPKGFFNQGKEGSNIWDGSADVLPFG